MILNSHFNLKDTHAFLSPSKHTWINYDEDKLLRVYGNHLAAQEGTRKHVLAHLAIEMGQKFAGNNTMSMYVNDGIGHRMTCEQILFANEFCYGAADTFSFRDEFLRIHDYKSGVHEANMDQLKIYKAIFCIEYDIRPYAIESELRIYQNNKIVKHVPDPDEIFEIMERIQAYGKILKEAKKEVYS